MHLRAKLRHVIVRQLMRWGLARLVLPMLVREIAPVPAPATVTIEPARTILALNPDRFREDLDILASTGRYRILRFPFDYQALLLLSFFERSDYRDAVRFQAPEPSDRSIRAGRETCHRFLRRLLPPLFEKLGVDAVISPAIPYRQDYDLGRVAHELGTPWILLHRENFKTAPAHERDVIKLGRGYRRFRGTKLIVHNQIMCDLLIESGFVTADQAESCGSMRMDGFVRRVLSGDRRPSRARKKVTFFSFFHCAGLAPMGPSYLRERFRSMWSVDGQDGFVELFTLSHASVAELAKQNPSVDFVIKPKWGGMWLDKIDEAIRSVGLSRQDIPNLTVSENLSPHELIFDADVVISFGSTTMAEAGIAGKPVIMPYFAEAKRPEYQDYILCLGHRYLFDIANSPEELKRLVLHRLVHSEVDEDVMAGRFALFEEYVSSMKGDALDRYVAVIEKVLESASHARTTLARVASRGASSPGRADHEVKQPARAP